ncbi:MAG: hypothetical protein EOQ95_27545 [Mesorhizobium sp.]|nr:MAG: hypothetical protein EOR23_31855 [Mesorhizobium sp.]RWM04952.1 MAG: hypothetical protein EOR71_25500 [Mesorhizobium sp.]RWO82151.1 MAG: hypothetical protein EOQ95_27545 [Mesorhizobium sp.]
MNHLDINLSHAAASGKTSCQSLVDVLRVVTARARASTLPCFASMIAVARMKAVRASIDQREVTGRGRCRVWGVL